MPNLQKIPFAISSSKGYSEKSNSAELLNMYAHIEESGSKSNHILINTEGAEEIGTLLYKIFGLYEFHDKLYVVTANFLYEQQADGSLMNVADVSFSQNVFIADNGTDIMIVGYNGYAYTPSTNTIKDMSTEEGWFPAQTVAYMDGYFIFNRSGTGQFFISKLFSTEIDPIDWASAESAPDDTVAVVVSNRQLWIFGERSSEVWYDSGDADFPFTRISGAVTDIGLTNHQTIAKIRESIFFVSNDFKVYHTNGYTPQVISTPSIEKLLNASDPSSLSSFSFNNEGHWFYVINIDDKTYVYDIGTAQWHRRASGEALKNWFINGAINLSNNNDPIGFSANSIYRLSIYELSEGGENIRREIVSLPINPTVNRFILRELQLDMEVAQEKNGSVILQTSKDDGHTWSNDNFQYLGKIGKYRHRVRWLRLGQFRDCIVKIVITDQMSIRITGMYGRF